MGKEIKKRTNKLKITLVISAIAIVVLAGLNIWFYMNKTSLELQLKERWDSWGSELWWHSYYQNMSNQLSTEKDALQSAYNDYVATHSHTNVEYDTLLSTYNNYVSAHSHSNTEYDTLQSAYNDYMATHIHTNSEYDTLQSIYNNYVATHSHTDTEYDTLQSAYDNYVATHHHTDSEYDNYVASHHHTDSEYNSLTVASLKTVGLDVTNFNHYWAWDPDSHLTITGYIFNMGTNTAYNCIFHVKVWSSTDALLLDTTVDLGSISGRSYIYKSTETPYTGSGSYWSVTLEWTNNP